jgi:hypothetical protein
MNPEIIDEPRPTIQQIRSVWKPQRCRKAVQAAAPAVSPSWRMTDFAVYQKVFNLTKQLNHLG